MKRAFYLLACIFLSSLSAFGQQIQAIGFNASNGSQTIIDIERTILLEADSNSEEVVISISEKAQTLELNIMSSVYRGKITIEIYDPNGVKQGNFAVGTQLENDYPALLSPSQSKKKKTDKEKTEVNEEQLKLRRFSLDYLYRFSHSKKEEVNGTIRKSLVEPQAGEWKVKILPNGASGKIDIKTSVVE